MKRYANSCASAPYLMSETIETLRQRLTEAREARHKLSIGGGVVEVQDSNGERIRYTPASAPRLASYISELETQIAKLEGGVSDVGPMRPWF